MNYDEIIDDFDNWIEKSVVDFREDKEDDNLMFENLDNLHVEKFEHAFIIRWGSKKGSFPRLAGSYLTDEYFILQSGELRNNELVIGDTSAKIPFDMQQLVYKYLLEDMLKDSPKGYIIDGLGLPSSKDKYKITVEKITNE